MLTRYRKTSFERALYYAILARVYLEIFFYASCLTVIVTFNISLNKRITSCYVIALIFFNVSRAFYPSVNSKRVRSPWSWFSLSFSKRGIKRKFASNVSEVVDYSAAWLCVFFPSSVYLLYVRLPAYVVAFYLTIYPSWKKNERQQTTYIIRYFSLGFQVFSTLERIRR